jgi:radical SAM superfamily enzyme YgiQ (UPF0313 family)
MFGLPQETEDDLLAIGEFLDELSRKVKIAINASINIFCPKPFSVWEGMAPDSEDILLAKRQLLVRNILANKKIKFSISQVKRSIVEALISRAGRNFAPILYRAYLGGAIYQSDSENFSWQIWQEAMRQENFDYHFYLEAKTENFPWSFIGR